MMRFWREVTADRSSGGLLGLVLSLCILAQALLVGHALAAMATPPSEHALCLSAIEGESEPAAPKSAEPCACGWLCGATQIQFALSPSTGLDLPIRFTERVERLPDLPARPFSAPVREQHRARAPPTSFATDLPNPIAV